MLISRTSAIASANSEVVCSKVYPTDTLSFIRVRPITYHALLASFFTVSALNIENKQVAGVATIDPDALSCLLSTTRFVHDFELGLEEQVQKCALTRALAADDSNNSIVSADIVHAALPQPSIKSLANQANRD